MTTTLSTTSGRHEHPPQPGYDRESHTLRRLGPLDRAALHLGVALIKWGRRPREVESRERIANRAEQHLARLERERAAERWLILNLPHR
jgi:hypothetical protein